jgi:uncharacterized membrane protein
MTENVDNDHLSSQSEKETSQNRYPMIDITRGMAVLLMIIFHFSYDLSAFKYLNINFQTDLFWWIFPRVIVFLFLFPMGQSLELVHRHSIDWSKVMRRFAKIGFFALCISVFTYYAFPQNWIYFGTLHCIALCSILVLPTIGRPKLSLLGALIMFIPLLFGFHWPWYKLRHASMDYIPVLPWIGVVFLGQWSYHFKAHQIRPPAFPGKMILAFMGRHSLKIYLLHQPILFGLVKAYYSATH